MTGKDLVKESEVGNVVGALMQLIKKSEKSTVSLIDSGKKIDLQIILSAVPSSRHRFKLPLPHSIDEDSREVCLFVKDLDKNDREYEKTVDHYQTLFKAKGVTKITKIIPIKALRTDYSEMPMRRTLSKAYDLFLADGKIMSFLPGLLGKVFFNHKKTKPIQVNLETGSLKEHLDKTINNPEFEFAGTGSTASVQVGHDKMSKEELTDNTMEALRVIAEKIPGGRNNLKKVSMRCTNAQILPLYINIVNPKDIKLAEKIEEMASFIDDVTTVEEGLVYVRADGLVKVIKDRKRKSTIKNDVDEKKPKLEIDVKDVTTETGNKKGKAQKLTGKVKAGKKTGKMTPVNDKKKGDVSDSEIKDEVIEIKEELDTDDESKDNITVKTTKKKKGNKSKENINSKTKKRKAKEMKAKNSDVIELKEENSVDDVKISEVSDEPRKKKGKQNTNDMKQKKSIKGVDKEPLKGSQIKAKGTQKKQTKVPGKKSFKGSSKG